MATRASGPDIDFTGRRRRRRRRLARTAAISTVVLVGAGGYYLLSRGGGLPSPFSREPERPKFTFQVSTVKGYKLADDNPSAPATQREARRIQRDLSEFYIDAFLAPRSWDEGVPEDAWKVFDLAARRHAKRNSSPFTVGRIGRSVTSLSPTKSALQIRVLFGPTGRPEAATAVAAFKAEGRTNRRQRFELSNRAGFVLRVVEGDWRIVGYPKVRTAVSPLASGGGSPSPEETP